MAKFRSWNENIRAFTYFEDGKYLLYENGKGIYPYEEFPLLFNWQNDEQSTGLFDKNGKEIFDGDIHKWGDKQGKVVFLINNGQWVVKYIDGEKCGQVAYDLDYITSCRGEIIGNIHEGGK